MKKYLLFILVLLVPFFVKADIREIKPVTEYNTGYAHAFYKDGYIYGVNGREENNYIEKMTVEGETIYKIERELTYYYTFIYNDNDYFYIIDLDPLQETYYYDVYVFKYNIETGEKSKEIKLENYYLKYIYNSIMTTYEQIGVCSDSTECTLIDLDTFTTSEADYDDLEMDGEKLWESQMFFKENNWTKNTDIEGFNEFIEQNNPNDYDLEYDDIDIIETNDFYFSPYGKKVNSKTLFTYTDKELSDYSFIEMPKGNYSIRNIYQYDNKLLIIYEKYEVTCFSKNPIDSYFPGECGGPNRYVGLYDVVYNIYTKSDGNGEVKVSSESGVEGEGVTFEIIPKEGYVLSEVKVIDADGNVIKFTDYKFTMPTADVTIEAVFVKGVSNPVTKDLIIYIAVIAVLSFIALTIIIKEMKREKKLTV